MEILKADAAMLSNYEVMTLLNDQKAQRQANEVAGTREAAENLRTVEFEVNYSRHCEKKNALVKNKKKRVALMRVERQH